MTHDTPKKHKHTHRNAKKKRKKKKKEHIPARHVPRGWGERGVLPRGPPAAAVLDASKLPQACRVGHRPVFEINIVIEHESKQM